MVVFVWVFRWLLLPIPIGVLVVLAGRGWLSSSGVTRSLSGTVRPAGWFAFLLVFFYFFGVYLLVLFFQVPLSLSGSSFHQKPSCSLSPSRGSSGFELRGGFVGTGCAAFVSGWSVVPFSEA